MENYKGIPKRKVSIVIMAFTLILSALSGLGDKFLLVLTFSVLLVLAYRLLGLVIGLGLILAALVGGIYLEMAVKFTLLALGVYSVYFALKFENPPNIEELTEEAEKKASGPV